MKKEIQGHRFFLLANYEDDLFEDVIESFPTLEEVLDELLKVSVDEPKQTSTSLVPVGLYYDQEMQPLGCALPLKGFEEYANVVKQVLDRCGVFGEHSLAANLELEEMARWAGALPGNATCESLGIMTADTPRADNPWALSAYKEDGIWYVTYVKIEVKFIKYFCGVIKEILDKKI